jgi:hypothetical protein
VQQTVSLFLETAQQARMHLLNAIGILKHLAKNQGALMLQDYAAMTQTFLSERRRSNSQGSSQLSRTHINASLPTRNGQIDTSVTLCVPQLNRFGLKAGYAAAHHFACLGTPLSQNGKDRLVHLACLGCRHILFEEITSRYTDGTSFTRTGSSRCLPPCHPTLCESTA